MGEAAWVIFAIRRQVRFTEQQRRCRHSDIAMELSHDIR
jgi:hypothetical protein